jgi:hypothetical protein
MNARMTVFAEPPAETDKTGETDSVSNHEFLSVLFGANLEHARPIVVSFEGNPNNMRGNAWSGIAWDNSLDTLSVLPQESNNYFSLAAFGPDDAGHYRRQKSRFNTLHAIMLDDIGTKVLMDRLTLRPTWMLETSPGNYQAGYLLREPLTDGLTADRLMIAIIDARLCDPGASGPRARLARLPKAVNGKHTPPFQCRMKEWAPATQYSLDELVNGLQLEVGAPGRPKRHRPISDRELPDDGDSVLIPCPKENGVLVALRDRRLYKAALGSGKHDITCPWVTEHTGGQDGGTAYFEPDDTWPTGGFRCLHGHCGERHIRDLLLLLNIEHSAARMKPTIRVIAGEIHRVVDAAEMELAHMHRYYQRGGLIVTVITDPGTLETRVQNISAPALVRALAGAAIWEKFDARANDMVRIDPPARHTQVLHESLNYNHLPVLNGIARQPYLRPDGSLMTASGYDAHIGLFGAFDAREFSIPEKPSRAQAEAALTQITDLLIEFKFGRVNDLAAALSAILTAAARPSLNHAPMFHIKAHMAGSGKSYLASLINAFATPQRGSPTAFPGDDDECRKLLLAELLSAPAVIEFDNLTSDLVAHKSLCTALTSEHMSGRILGVSKTASVSTRVLFLSSGNNVGPVQDMGRRCVTINLDPGCEVPAARKFKRPHLLVEVLRERGRYISAALTIICAWIAAGRPAADCAPLLGFTDWTDLCRYPLLWLGLDDPVKSTFEAMAEDPDRETLGRLLTVWQSVFGARPTMVRDAVQQLPSLDSDQVELMDVLEDIAEERGKINRRRLGWWIRRHVGRIVDGRYFVRTGGNRSAEAWQVKSVSPLSPVPDWPPEKCVSNSIKDDADAYIRGSRGE